jgi:phosphatidylserine/phosphatidylglycerophosphate/cardiolipin synthase-like enzyme
MSGTLRLCVALMLLAFHLQASASLFQDHFEYINDNNQHYAYLLETGDVALLARLHLIRQARHTIDIQTFIWEADSTGTLVFAELLYAARRGVRIRILIDDLSLRQSADYVAYLSSVHPNIEIRQFNPLASRIDANVFQKFKGYALEFDKVNRRMHTKTFIVDNKFGISGGRNYADDYFDRSADRSFKDRDLLVIGNAISDMQDSFNTFWRHERSVSSLEMKDVIKAIESHNMKLPPEAVQYQRPSQFDAVSKCADSDTCMMERLLAQGMPVSSLVYIADSPDKTTSRRKISRTTSSIWELIESADRSITLQTPYLIIGWQSVLRLKALRKRNADLIARVSTNSLAASDHFQAYAYSYKNKKNYLKDIRLEIFEMKPAPADIDQFIPTVDGVSRSPDHYVCVHGKTFVFDSTTVWLGTFNLDRRSSDLNTEAGFIIEDAAFAQQIENLIEQDMAPRNAWTIGYQRNIPVFTRLSRTFESLFKYMPFVNIWPFRYTTSYELRADGEIVPFYSDRFHDNYRLVGQFPGNTASIKSIQTRLWKAFLGPAEPIF